MAPPSPNTTGGHLWEIAPVPILQLLTMMHYVRISLVYRTNPNFATSDAINDDY